MTRRLAVVHVICLAVMVTSSATGSEHGGELPDFFSLDMAKHRKQLACGLPTVRVAEVQGLSYLRHYSFENDLIRAHDDEETAVRRKGGELPNCGDERKAVV